MEHIRNALEANGYKPWMLNLPQIKQNSKDNTNQSQGTGKKQYPLPLPYTNGL